LITDEIGDSTDYWKGGLNASVNDIIQYDSATDRWSIVWDASAFDSTVEYVTNLNTGIQYKFNGIAWVKSYEGIYLGGKWTIVL
jgi:glutamine cyclotransferase